MVEWRVYGCGSPSSGQFLQSSYEFVDKKTRIQIDFGNGALYQRCRSEKSFTRAMNSISNIILTHGHPDHLLDLGRLYVAWKWTPDYRPEKQITLHATHETLNLVQTMFNAIRLEGAFEDAFHLKEVRIDQPFQIDSIEITPHRVQHIEGAVGYRLVTPSGKQVAFTGDTGYFDDLADIFSGVDLFIVETSFNERDTPYHLDLEQTAKVVGKIDPEAVVLVHFYPEMESKSAKEFERVLRRYYQGAYYPAYDGLALKWVAKNKTWVESALF